jgi:hypothetical protein
LTAALSDTKQRIQLRCAWTPTHRNYAIKCVLSKLNLYSFHTSKKGLYTKKGNFTFY